MVYALTIDQNSFIPAKIGNVSTLLNVVLPLVTAGAALICLVMALFGAFNLLTHGDNPEAIKKAYSTIIFAVIGLFIVVASFLIVRLIGSMLGINNLIPT